MPITPEAARSAAAKAQKQIEHNFYVNIVETIDKILSSGGRCYPKVYEYSNSPNDQINDSLLHVLNDYDNILNKIIDEYTKLGWIVTFNLDGDEKGLRFKERNTIGREIW